jgi:hypothetical protein
MASPLRRKDSPARPRLPSSLWRRRVGVPAPAPAPAPAAAGCSRRTEPRGSALSRRLRSAAAGGRCDRLPGSETNAEGRSGFSDFRDAAGMSVQERAALTEDGEQLRGGIGKVVRTASRSAECRTSVRAARSALRAGKSTMRGATTERPSRAPMTNETDAGGWRGTTRANAVLTDRETQQAKGGSTWPVPVNEAGMS